MIKLEKCLSAITNYFNDVAINVMKSEINNEGLEAELFVQLKKVEETKLLFRIDVLATGYCSFRLIGDKVEKNISSYEAINKFNNMSLLNSCIDEKGCIQFCYDTYCKKIRDVIQFMDMVLSDLTSDEITPLIKEVLKK